MHVVVRKNCIMVCTSVHRVHEWSGVPRPGFAFHAGVMDYHRDSDYYFQSNINQ